MNKKLIKLFNKIIIGDHLPLTTSPTLFEVI